MEKRRNRASDLKDLAGKESSRITREIKSLEAMEDEEKEKWKRFYKKREGDFYSGDWEKSGQENDGK